MRRPVALLLLALSLPLLAACATSPVVTGTPRPAIDPSQVRLYHAPPPGGFEEIARLEVNSGAFTYGNNAKDNAVRNRLREQAARLGANGVLLVGTATGPGGTNVGVGGGVGRGGGSTFSSVGVGVNISPQQRYASGIAIHVPNPPPDAATTP